MEALHRETVGNRIPAPNLAAIAWFSDVSLDGQRPRPKAFGSVRAHVQIPLRGKAATVMITSGGRSLGARFEVDPSNDRIVS